MKVNLSIALVLVFGAFAGISQSYSASSPVSVDETLQGSRWTVFEKDSDKAIGVATFRKRAGLITVSVMESGKESESSLFVMTVGQSPVVSQDESSRTASNDRVSWQCKVSELTPLSMRSLESSTLIENIETFRNYATPCKSSSAEFLRYPPKSKKKSLMIAKNLETMVYAEDAGVGQEEPSDWIRFERVR